MVLLIVLFCTANVNKVISLLYSGQWSSLLYCIVLLDRYFETHILVKQAMQTIDLYCTKEERRFFSFILAQFSYIFFYSRDILNPLTEGGLADLQGRGVRILRVLE